MHCSRHQSDHLEAVAFLRSVEGDHVFTPHLLVDAPEFEDLGRIGVRVGDLDRRRPVTHLFREVECLIVDGANGAVRSTARRAPLEE